MPTYEYACTDCGTRIEVVQKMSEPALETCGACGGRLRKVFHPAGILFKGSGFYATDNRSKSKGGASAPSSSSESGPKPDEKKAEKKAEKGSAGTAKASDGASGGGSRDKKPVTESA